MFDINKICDYAIALGITLTNAEVDTEICNCWTDRVAQAQSYFAAGKMEQCQVMIDEANRYAI